MGNFIGHKTDKPIVDQLQIQALRVQNLETQLNQSEIKNQELEMLNSELELRAMKINQKTKSTLMYIKSPEFVEQILDSSLNNPWLDDKMEYDYIRSLLNHISKELDSNFQALSKN